MSKHTPGPWKNVQDKQFPSLSKIVSLDGDLINEAFALSSPQEQANAMLIAAAPEMLDALKKIRATKCVPMDLHLSPCPACLAQEAIAKATGGAE